MLELLGCRQALENFVALDDTQAGVARRGLDMFLYPALLLWNLNVHVLAADFAAISLAQSFQNFA